MGTLRLLVFGATGGTGRHLVKQALSAGHDVTACVRDPSKVDVEHPRLTVVRGDILEPSSLEVAFSGAVDAIACTVGMFGKPRLADGTRNIVAVMRKYDVNRIVVVSSLGAGDSHRQGNLLAKAMNRLILRNELRDKTRQEEVLANSTLSWSVFRPPRLTDETACRNDIVLWTGSPPRRKLRWTLSRATLASYVLDAVETGAHDQAAVNMSEPG